VAEAAEAAKAVVVRVAVAVVDVLLVVAVAGDKAVAEVAAAQVVAAADFRAVAVDREVEGAVVDVLPAVGAGAAETVNSLSFGGASRVRGAPLFY
jgi:hypothetical protein